MTATRRLLLVSTSRTHGSGYLEHCAVEAGARFAGAATIGFVPYAAHDHDRYAEAAAAAFAAWGLDLVSVHPRATPAEVVREVDGLFIGGGNTFRLVRDLHRHGLIEPIRQRVANGMPYMGTSAGSNVACPTLCTTNDMPIVEPPSFEALGLVPFQINPHYLEPDPDSTHQGETRDQRLAEYHEENEVPVIALREGAMLIVDDDAMRLEGSAGARLFESGSDPRDVDPGNDLSRLLEGAEPG